MAASSRSRKKARSKGRKARKVDDAAEDEDVVVRALVASHPGCPSETLALLVEDDDLLVVGVALSNPYLPRDARDKALEAERRTCAKAGLSYDHRSFPDDPPSHRACGRIVKVIGRRGGAC